MRAARARGRDFASEKVGFASPHFRSGTDLVGGRLLVVGKGTTFKHHGISPKHFPLYLKELEFRYNHRFELIFEQLVAFMSDFIPELPDEAELSLSSTSQRE